MADRKSLARMTWMAWKMAWMMAGRKSWARMMWMARKTAAGKASKMVDKMALMMELQM